MEKKTKEKKYPEIVLDERYWDCSCGDNDGYIHLKANGNYCTKCGSHEQDGMPDSRVNEIAKLYKKSNDKKLEMRKFEE